MLPPAGPPKRSWEAAPGSAGASESYDGRRCLTSFSAMFSGSSKGFEEQRYLMPLLSTGSRGGVGLLQRSWGGSAVSSGT